MKRKLLFIITIILFATLASCVEIPVDSISRIEVHGLSLPDPIYVDEENILIPEEAELHVYYTGNLTSTPDEVLALTDSSADLDGTGIIEQGDLLYLKTDVPGTYTLIVSYGGVTVRISYDVISETSFTVPDDYATIQAAIDAASPGYTIFVDPGTYVESNIVIDKTLTIEGTGTSREDVLIVPAAEDGNVDSAFGTNAQNGFIIAAHSVTLRNMTLDGQGNLALTPDKNNFRTGVVTDDGAGVWNNLTVDNLLIKNLYRRGISIWPPNVYGTHIEDSRIENVTYNQGIQAAGQSTVINNEIDGAFQGIVAAAVDITPTGLIRVSGNTLSNITKTPLSFDGQPRAIQIGIGNYIYSYEVNGNTISDVAVQDPEIAGTVGIYTVRPSSDSILSNNVITLNSHQAVGIVAGWGYEQGYTVSNNTITVGNNAIGMIIHANGVSENPLNVINNVLSTHASVDPATSNSYGIYVSNQYLFHSGDHGNSYATLDQNSISGFFSAIYTYRTSNLTHMVELFHSNTTFTNNTHDTLSEAADGVDPFVITA